MKKRSAESYAEQSRLMREHTAAMRAAGFPGGNPDGPSAAELKALVARHRRPERDDLTGRILGDPPIGRSALDLKRAAEEAAAARLAQQQATRRTLKPRPLYRQPRAEA